MDIRWQQIHLDTATIDIRRAKNGTPGIHGLQGDELRLLRALRREHPHADFVFLSERKAPLSVDGAQKLIERLGEAAKLPFPIHAHMLRRCWLRPGGPWSRYKDATGIHGPSLDREHVVYTAVADKRIRILRSLSGRGPQEGGAPISRYFGSCEPVHTRFLRTSLQGIGTFQGNSKWPMRLVGQGDSYAQPIPFAERPALPPSCNSDRGFDGGFTILLCRFRANLSDQRCLGHDGSTFSRVQNRSVLDA